MTGRSESILHTAQMHKWPFKPVTFSGPILKTDDDDGEYPTDVVADETLRDTTVYEVIPPADDHLRSFIRLADVPFDAFAPQAQRDLFNASPGLFHVARRQGLPNHIGIRGHGKKAGLMGSGSHMTFPGGVVVVVFDSRIEEHALDRGVSESHPVSYVSTYQIIVPGGDNPIVIEQDTEDLQFAFQLLGKSNGEVWPRVRASF